MTRIAVAGFQHETNTFAPIPTEYSDFERAGAWPALTRGSAIPPGFSGLNLPVSGFLAACRHETVPVLWAAAEPGGFVQDEAFDRISMEIARGIEGAGADAAYLDLHGAMTTCTHDDGEAEILRRIRNLVGDDFPIAVSLDLHGNMSRRFFELASVVTVYRTYPHIDIAATGARAAALLDRHLASPLSKCFRQIDFLIPITAQSTSFSPARELYGMLEDVGAVSADVCLGFPPADVPNCGPSVFAYAPSQSAAEGAVERIAQAMLKAEPEFAPRLTDVDEAVRIAMANTGSKPVVIADPQDNPGAGATGDTTGILRSLAEAGATDAALSMLFDPEAAKAAHSAGAGSEITLDIGGRFTEFSRPFSASWTVETLSDGRFTFTGPMFGGSHADLGPVAHLRMVGAGISVVVGSVRTQNADKEMFRVVGIEPAERRILCVKSAVHFLADYQDIAEQVIFAESPGANPCRLGGIDFRRLRDGVRLLS